MPHPGTVVTLRSAAFSDSDLIPRRHTGDGEDCSPPLEWDEVPPDARELAVVCEDSDAPSGTFLHWLVTGIDPRTRAIGSGELPAGATTWPNGFGRRRYGGPKPPVGDKPHRYVFRLYALDEPLRPPSGARVDDLRRDLAAHQVASGTLVGRYGR